MTKRTFAAEVGGLGDEPLVRVRRAASSKIVAERVGDVLAGALRRARRSASGRGDDLVLEARVELHVPRLVDLLGGEERRLLLAAVGADEPGELAS